MWWTSPKTKDALGTNYLGRTVWLVRTSGVLGVTFTKPFVSINVLLREVDHASSLGEQTEAVVWHTREWKLDSTSAGSTSFLPPSTSGPGLEPIDLSLIVTKQSPALPDYPRRDILLTSATPTGVRVLCFWLLSTVPVTIPRPGESSTVL